MPHISKGTFERKKASKTSKHLVAKVDIGLGKQFSQSNLEPVINIGSVLRGY